MTRTTPELAPLSPTSWTTQTGWRLITMCDLARNGLHTVESGFEPGMLQPLSQDLATRLPRPLLQFKFHCIHLGVFRKVKKNVLFTWPILPDFGMAHTTRPAFKRKTQ
ncbi:hypothetical protein AVEN_72190-1 [Araneus ventricosus]|uniref:Uncharacterized protein n=1 Tax=Araneus ventricosus TaxID=182803 RepID=A0A4Y2EJZ7_ARAVE|nr:hypothetical protein AVEN_72190-1 [Araneus ventricosus]